MKQLGRCPFCRHRRWMDLVDVWDDRSWMLASCCEESDHDLLEQLQHALTLPLHERARFLRPLRELFQSYGIPFRMAFELTDEGRITWEDGLQLSPLSDAAFVREWIGMHHRHNRPPVAWLAAWGAWNGGELVAVATLGLPKSRRLAERGILEVTRVCTRTDVEPALTFNASSMLYAEAAREAKRRGAPKVVTYTLHGVEDGRSLKAAGWTAEWVTRAESWDRPSRPRPNSPPARKKVRWSKTFKHERATQRDLWEAA